MGSTYQGFGSSNICADSNYQELTPVQEKKQKTVSSTLYQNLINVFEYLTIFQRLRHHISMQAVRSRRLTSPLPSHLQIKETDKRTKHDLHIPHGSNLNLAVCQFAAQHQKLGKVDDVQQTKFWRLMKDGLAEMGKFENLIGSVRRPKSGEI